MRNRVITVAALALAASLTAAPAQADEGRYWRVEAIMTIPNDRTFGSGYRLVERRVSVDWTTPQGASWYAYRPLGAAPATRKDEAAWRADGAPTSWTYRTEGMKFTLSTKPGKGYVKRQDTTSSGFTLGEKKITYQQVQALPADAAGIRQYVTREVQRWIAEAVEEAKSTSPKSTAKDWTDHQDLYVAQYLTMILHRLPATEKVRAAAYEALKTTKGVTDQGQVKDPLGRPGHKLALPAHESRNSVRKEQVIVDPRTKTLLAGFTQNADTTDSGEKLPVDERTTAYTAGWTDTEPAVPQAR